MPPVDRVTDLNLLSMEGAGKGKAEAWACASRGREGKRPHGAASEWRWTASCSALRQGSSGRPWRELGCGSQLSGAVVVGVAGGREGEVKQEEG